MPQYEKRYLISISKTGTKQCTYSREGTESIGAARVGEQRELSLPEIGKNKGEI